MPRAGGTERVLGHENGGEGKSVLQVARRVAATIGTDFFRAIAKNLAEALTADCVLIVEFIGGQVERCRTLAAWLDGQPATFEYELAESASAQLLLGKPCLWRSDVQTRFPGDKLLAEVGAQACIGVPLTAGADRPIGALIALYRRPVTSIRVPKAMLDIFAERAAAELNRKREEEKLRESEQRYRAFIARNVDAMWRIEFEKPVDTDLSDEEQLEAIYRYGYLAECNDATAQLLGLDRADQLTGSRLDDIAPLSDPSIREANLAAIRAKYQFTWVETSPLDGYGRRRHMLRSQWGIVEDGKLERIWGSNRDITEIRHSELALDASEQRMADLLETMRLLVVMQDPEGAIAFCNQHLYRLTGWQPGQLLGKDWLEKMIPPEERPKILAEFARSADDPNSPVHFESKLLGPDNRRWHISWDSTILRSSTGTVAARANIGRDITEYKALEEQFRQSQKLAGIGRLAGGLAHDFNNLLTVILGYSNALLEEHGTTDPGYSSLLEIRSAAEKGADLTGRLLAFSRRRVLQAEVLNLNTIVELALGMLRRLIGDNVQVVTKLEPELGLVRIDGGSFHQILMNLAVNARDAMPHGGTLTIGTSNVSAGLHHQAGLPPGDYVQLAVTDTGTGMTEEVRKQVFEPFFTTKDVGKGTGLGLSTVYGIVQQSGGHIVVESELDQGTNFRIYLPRAQAPVEQALEPTDYRALPGGTETILVVEDREDVRGLTVNLLTGLGYTVIEANGSASALTLARDTSRVMHLMVSDVLMPGIPGGELADLVRSLRPGIKVLLVSGGDNEAVAQERLATPGFDFLAKPFTPAELAAAVRSLLDADLI
jgi:PAS domain S-box-containing protein